MSEDVFSPVVGFEGRYLISNTGKVASVPFVRSDGSFIPSKVMSNRMCNTRKYGQVNLWDGHKAVSKYVHRLVAEAFIENPENFPEVNHKDRNKENNHVDNLEWVSPQQNSEHAHARGYLINWEGEDIFIFNMRKFCRENSLDRNIIKKLIVERL